MTDASAFGNLVVTDTLYVGMKLIVNGTVQAKQLCLEDVCITKDQLKALLNQLQSSPSSSAPTAAPTPQSPLPSPPLVVPSAAADSPLPANVN